MAKPDRPSSFKVFSSKTGVLVIFAASLMYLLTGLTAMVSMYDEGIPTYGAERILNGEIPYRDFWTIYAPAQFYMLAGLFKVFGSSIFAERLYDSVLRALIAMLVFLAAVRLTSLRWALFVWLVVAVWLKYLGYFAYPNIPAVLFALASLYALLGFFHSDKPKVRLFFAGLLAGLAGLFRHDTGFYLILSELALVLPFAFFHRIQKNGGEGLFKRLAKLTPFAVAYLFGVVLPLLPVGIYFFCVVPTQMLIDDLVIFPLKVFPAVRRIPFPAPLPDVFALSRGEVSVFRYLAQLSESWIFYFSLSALLAAFVFFAFGKHRLRRRKNEGPPAPIWSWEIGLFLVFGLLSLNNLWIRSDLPHLLPSFVSAALISAGLGWQLFTKVRARKGFILGVFFLTIGLLLVYPFYRWQTPEMNAPFRPLFLGHNLERARGVGVNPNQVDAIRYLQSVSFPREWIFVGNHRHDLIYNNDIMFYFLSGLPCATKYHELFPGSATSAAVQSEIVEALKVNNVRHIVLVSHHRDRGVTTEPIPVRLLDDFIARNYQPAAEFGDWSVWERK